MKNKVSERWLIHNYKILYNISIKTGAASLANLKTLSTNLNYKTAKTLRLQLCNDFLQN